MSDIKVTMGGDMSGFRDMLTRAKLSARQFSNEVGRDVGSSWAGAFSIKNLVGGAAGYLGFEALKGHLEGLVNKAESLKDLSEQFDMSTDSIQKWEKATRNAGLTFNTFLRGMETMRMKREDALSDPKKMAAWEALGISRSELANTEDSNELLLRVLNSKGTRGQLADILGPRGVRLKAAAGGYAGSSIGMTEGDIQSLDKASKDITKAKESLNTWSMRGGPGAMMTGLSRILNGDFKGGMESFQGFFTAGLSTVLKPGNPLLSGKPIKPASSPDNSLPFSDEDYKKQVKEQEDANKAADKVREKWIKENMPETFKVGRLDDLGLHGEGGQYMDKMRVQEKQLEALLRIEANTQVTAANFKDFDGGSY